jgi:hypothetical protein
VTSATQVTATAPAGTGTVDVTVTSSAGTSAASSADRFTYMLPARAAPTVLSIMPASGPIAGGTIVIITGTNFTGATAVSFGGTPASSFTVNSSSQITALAPAGAAGAVDVTVTTRGGASASSGADQFTYVSPPPPPVKPAPVKAAVSLAVKAGQTIHSQPLFKHLSSGAHVTLVVVGKKPAGHLVLNTNGTFTYTPPKHFHGKVTFKIEGRDSAGLSKPITVTLHVK